jgi:hypothetical protein
VKAIALAIVTCVACHRRPPLAACTDDLRGVYVSADGARWNVIDSPDGYEVYPLFDDVPAERRGLEIGPRVIDLEEADGVVDGWVRRRYMRGAERCDAKVAIHLTKCSDDTLEIVVADPEPPLDFARCTWPRLAPSHVERWRRE